MEYKSNYNRKLVANLYDFRIDELLSNSSLKETTIENQEVDKNEYKTNR